jgi:predicted ester cyclase
MRIHVAVAALVFGMSSLSGCGGSEPPPQAPPAPSAPPAPLASSTPAAPPAPVAPPKPSLSDLELASAKAAADAITQHDAQKYAALFTPDGVDKGAGEPDSVGHDAIVARMQALFTTFPDIKLSIGRVWQKGNLVVATWAWTGTDTGGFLGKKPTGRPAGLEGVSLGWYTDDGLVKELHRYGDLATLVSQLDPKAKKGSFRAPPTLPASMDVVSATGTPDEDKEIDLAKALYAALDNKKVADVMGAFTEESTAEDYTMPTSMKGLKDWKAMYDSYSGAFPDFKQSIANQVAIKDFVISEGTFNGTHKGAMGPIKATGKPVSLHFVDIAQYKDGKIAHFWTWANAAELLMQVGVMKPPAPPKAPAADAKGPPADAKAPAAPKK